MNRICTLKGMNITSKLFQSGQKGGGWQRWHKSEDFTWLRLKIQRETRTKPQWYPPSADILQNTKLETSIPLRNPYFKDLCYTPQSQLCGRG